MKNGPIIKTRLKKAITRNQTLNKAGISFNQTEKRTAEIKKRYFQDILIPPLKINQIKLIKKLP